MLSNFVKMAILPFTKAIFDFGLISFEKKDVFHIRYVEKCAIPTITLKINQNREKNFIVSPVGLYITKVEYYQEGELVKAFDLSENKCPIFYINKSGELNIDDVVYGWDLIWINTLSTFERKNLRVVEHLKAKKCEFRIHFQIESKYPFFFS